MNTITVNANRVKGTFRIVAVSGTEIHVDGNDFETVQEHGCPEVNGRKVRISAHFTFDAGLWRLYCPPPSYSRISDDRIASLYHMYTSVEGKGDPLEFKQRERVVEALLPAVREWAELNKSALAAAARRRAYQAYLKAVDNLQTAADVYAAAEQAYSTARQQVPQYTPTASDMAKDPEARRQVEILAFN